MALQRHDAGHQRLPLQDPRPGRALPAAAAAAGAEPAAPSSSVVLEHTAAVPPMPEITLRRVSILGEDRLLATARETSEWKAATSCGSAVIWMRVAM